jgi:hypothetical protein
LGSCDAISFKIRFASTTTGGSSGERATAGGAFGEGNGE